MADVLRGRHPDPVPVGDAFDSATLAAEDTPPAWPRNPVPVGGEAPRRAPRAGRGRPPGADDLTPLFATGLVLVTTFAVGAWAAPTADEASAFATPLANILARRIDVAAKLGRDASDTIALAVAVMAYAYRVVPLATERVRDSLEQQRQQRTSRAGLERPAEAANGAGAHGVAARSGNGHGPDNGPTFDPFDALAKARAAGLGVFGGVPDTSASGYPTVGDR